MGFVVVYRVHSDIPKGRRQPRTPDLVPSLLSLSPTVCVLSGATNTSVFVSQLPLDVIIVPGKASLSSLP